MSRLRCFTSTLRPTININVLKIRGFLFETLSDRDGYVEVDTVTQILKFNAWLISTYRLAYLWFVIAPSINNISLITSQKKVRNASDKACLNSCIVHLLHINGII